jgi:hypothetical protein
MILSREDDQKLRRLFAGSSTTFTYKDRAEAEITLGNQGRFSGDIEVVGSRPLPSYPRLPSSSPWAQDWGPPEPPFDLDISYVEAVGTPAEVQQSLDELALASTAVVHPAEGAASEVAVAPLPADAGGGGDGHRPQPSFSRRTFT